MLRKSITVLVFGIAALQGGATQVDNYEALRKQYSVTQSTGVEALETFVGKRVLEVKGVVKGTIRTGDGAILMIKTSGGADLHVDATEVPDWLQGNEVPARLLIEAERLNENSMLRARLIAATSHVAVPAATTKTNSEGVAPPRRATNAASSRSMPPALTGNIGKGAPRVPKNWQLPATDALPYYVDFIKRRNKKLPHSEAVRIAQGVLGFSLQYGVDARLIMAMVLCESNFNPNDTSRSGAMGLGQLMPGTAKGLGVTNAYDSIDNLYGTVRMVRGHLERWQKKTGDSYKALVLMLASYNAGSGAVRRHGGVPPYRETQNYVRKVIAVYRQLCGQ